MGCGASTPKAKLVPHVPIKKEHCKEDGTLDRERLLTYVFAHCDDDNDGNLSLRELMQLSKEQTKEILLMQQKVFEQMDANGDGVVSKTEFLQYHQTSEMAALSDEKFNDQASLWLDLAKKRDVSKPK